MMELETASLGAMPDAGPRAARRVRGLRGYDMLARRRGRRRAPAGLGRTPPSCRRRRCSPRSRAPGATSSPQGRLDQDLQQVDLRGRNSWRLTLAEVPSVELLETQLVNAVAPFVLNARLKPLMLRTPERDKHIVNVSAVEGQFYRRFKTTKHPHTNMAKAALNMMTRTSAADYHADGIHMNSVDTGWVTDEDPVAHRRAQDRRAPLPPAARHRRRRGPHRRPDHRRLQHRRRTCGASSSRTTGPPTGETRGNGACASQPAASPTSRAKPRQRQRQSTCTRPGGPHPVELRLDVDEPVLGIVGRSPDRRPGTRRGARASPTRTTSRLANTPSGPERPATSPKQRLLAGRPRGGGSRTRRRSRRTPRAA